MGREFQDIWVQKSSVPGGKRDWKSLLRARKHRNVPEVDFGLVYEAAVIGYKRSVLLAVHRRG